MKKFTLYILTALSLLSIFPIQSKAAVKTTPVPMIATKPNESAEVDSLFTRLDEIKAIDKSKLKASEKKELRKERRSIKSELASNGVYISVGAIIIIVLLLILLL
jgi:hypothetical protein